MLRRTARNRSHWRLFFMVCILVTCGLMIFQIGFLKGKECRKDGLAPCQGILAAVSNEEKTRREQIEFSRHGSIVSDDALGLVKPPSIQVENVIPFNAPPVDIKSTIREENQQFEIKNAPNNVYVQIREADTPILGDFTCGGTVVPKCCAFYVATPQEGKKICDAFSEFCKGFVMTTLSTSLNHVQYMIYLKKTLRGMVTNYVTDVYVKSSYVNEMKWNGPTVNEAETEIGGDIEKSVLNDKLKLNRDDVGNQIPYMRQAKQG